ncbi:TssA family type VI secretion system protein [Pseudoalteromonas piscicida]|uniref:TssA family type VI secretion system protein n=1 Tax=Pseudoalteromonas piscicida TaxID=43662 RepID=UPI0030A24D47
MSQPHKYQSWDAWLARLLEPLTDAPCGEDLKYEESFKSLKASSSGVAEPDFKANFILASTLLESQTKDIRVASYLALAATAEFGLDGLIHSLDLFNQLLLKFQAQIHPTKARARASVHTWFLQQQQRLLGVATAHSATTPEQWPELQRVLDQYATESVAILDADSGPLADLKQWCEQGLISQPVPVISAQEVQKVQEPSKTATPAVETQARKEAQTPVAPQPNSVKPSPAAAVIPETPQSDSAYTDQVRKLLSYDRDNQNWMRAIRLSRAVRWGALALPPHDGELKTRLPAPRQAAFVPIENALAAEKFSEALKKAEALFMEGAMHFNLNLQRLTITALEGLKLFKEAQWIELELAAIADQYPTLLSLKYEDGSEFCSAANRERIGEHKLLTQSDSAANDSDQKVWLDKFKEAQALVDQNKLAQALKIMEGNAQDKFEFSKQKLYQARLLMRSERADLAHPMFMQLLQDIEQYRLDLWHESFALEVWRYAKQCNEAVSAEQGDEFDQRATDIKQQMLVTKVSSAIDWV